MTFSDFELQVIARSPASDLLHETARKILGDRPNQPKPLPINEAKTENPPEIKAVSEDDQSSDTFSLDQVPNICWRFGMAASIEMGQVGALHKEGRPYPNI